MRPACEIEQFCLSRQMFCPFFTMGMCSKKHQKDCKVKNVSIRSNERSELSDDFSYYEVYREVSILEVQQPDIYGEDSIPVRKERGECEKRVEQLD